MSPAASVQSAGENSGEPLFPQLENVEKPHSMSSQSDTSDDDDLRNDLISSPTSSRTSTKPLEKPRSSASSKQHPSDFHPSPPVSLLDSPSPSRKSSITKRRSKAFAEEMDASVSTNSSSAARRRRRTRSRDPNAPAAGSHNREHRRHRSQSRDGNSHRESTTGTQVHRSSTAVTRSGDLNESSSSSMNVKKSTSIRIKSKSKTLDEGSAPSGSSHQRIRSKAASEQLGGSVRVSTSRHRSVSRDANTTNTRQRHAHRSHSTDGAQHHLGQKQQQHRSERVRSRSRDKSGASHIHHTNSKSPSRRLSRRSNHQQHQHTKSPSSTSTRRSVAGIFERAPSLGSVFSQQDQLLSSSQGHSSSDRLGRHLINRKSHPSGGSSSQVDDGGSIASTIQSAPIVAPGPGDFRRGDSWKHKGRRPRQSEKSVSERSQQPSSSSTKSRSTTRRPVDDATPRKHGSKHSENRHKSLSPQKDSSSTLRTMGGDSPPVFQNSIPKLPFDMDSPPHVMKSEQSTRSRMSARNNPTPEKKEEEASERFDKGSPMSGVDEEENEDLSSTMSPGKRPQKSSSSTMHSNVHGHDTPVADSPPKKETSLKELFASERKRAMVNSQMSGGTMPPTTSSVVSSWTGRFASADKRSVEDPEQYAQDLEGNHGSFNPNGLSNRLGQHFRRRSLGNFEQLVADPSVASSGPTTHDSVSDVASLGSLGSGSIASHSAFKKSHSFGEVSALLGEKTTGHPTEIRRGRRPEHIKDAAIPSTTANGGIGIKIVRSSKSGLDATVHDTDALSHNGDDDDAEPKYLQLCLPAAAAPTITNPILYDAPDSPLAATDGAGGNVFQRFRTGIQTPTTARKSMLGTFRRKKGEEE